MIKQILQTIQFGEMQNYRSIAAFPIFCPPRENPVEYDTLADAMLTGLITITEVDQGGSVPELKLTGGSEKPILILEGEELMGAKQNRILVTTILVAVKGEVIIPVNCTERGRWAYNSPKFRDSGNLSAYDVKREIKDSVTNSLFFSNKHRANQIRTWEKIEELHSKSGTYYTSGSRAMSDAYSAKMPELNEILDHFPILEGQRGILFIIDNKIAGLEILSRPDIYSRLHEKICKSFFISGFSGDRPNLPAGELNKMCEDFIQSAAGLETHEFKSVGLGTDVRLKGKNILGSGLVYSGELIHGAVISSDEG
ncbi:MAG: hypothetical protein PHD61_08280 [Bacteroidales bacterium]|nr:hypothetical protein [Lentimicrobiaceae bacterium]MDD5695287.1 hypothetical protein [Bacteroidales bacterium]